MGTPPQRCKTGQGAKKTGFLQGKERCPPLSRLAGEGGLRMQAG